MATVPYLLELPSPTAMPARTLRNGVSSYAVNAESTADAAAFVKGLYADQVGAMIDQSTVTQIAAAANLNGYNFRVQILGAFNAGTGLTPIVFDQTVKADGTNVGFVAASQTLTGDGTVVSDGDTVTIGSKVYTFQATLTNVDGHVHIVSANASATLTNLFHAINGSGGVSGTDYAAATTANAQVTATNPSGTTVVVTAVTAGSAANAIATTEASTHLSWGSTTMAGGVGATDALSSLALKMVAALNADAAIAAAAWNDSTHVLTVAATGDALGDHRVVAAITPPTSSSTLSNTIPGFISAKVDGGIAAAALTLTLAADSYTVPTVVAVLGEQVSE